MIHIDPGSGNQPWWRLTTTSTLSTKANLWKGNIMISRFFRFLYYHEAAENFFPTQKHKISGCGSCEPTRTNRTAVVNFPTVGQVWSGITQDRNLAFNFQIIINNKDPSYHTKEEQAYVLHYSRETTICTTTWTTNWPARPWSNHSSIASGLTHNLD